MGDEITKVINGVVYEKFKFAGDDEFPVFWMPPHNDTESPIVCDCGSIAFSLTYGSYEIRATCRVCNRSEVVYDG
jgi:hypothetical protein